jgi:hypothetical protein
MTRSTLFATVSALSVAATLALATAYAQTPPAGGPPQQGAPGGPQAGQQGGPQGGPPPNGQQYGDQQQQNAANEAAWPVLFVTGIDVVRAPHNGRDIIIAHGLVSSSDWRAPTLIPITEGRPVDGVLDLLLQAQAPQKPGPLGAFMEVDAILPLGHDHPYKAVRVRSASNALTLKEIPGRAEVKKLKNDCGTCIGKHFVAKGETPPANMAAGDILREEDLLWQVRVIKPRDGIHSYTLDPNRLTLVLSEDGRIVDAAWD